MGQIRPHSEIGHVSPVRLISPIPLVQIQPVGPDDNLQDIRPPIFYNHSWTWLLVLLAIVVVISFGILLWYLLKPKRQLTPRSAYALAIEQLEEARKLLREDNPMPYAVFVSETIRSYLSQRFHAPFTRRTTEEFLRQMEADRDTPLAAHSDLLREFLQSCDLVKFAEYHPRLAELELVQQRATTFVAATKPEPVPAARNGVTPP